MSTVLSNVAGRALPADPALQDLLQLINELGGSITPRQMARRRSRWCTTHIAEMALLALVRAGHGELGCDPPGPKGGPPRFRFKLFDLPKTAKKAKVVTLEDIFKPVAREDDVYTAMKEAFARIRSRTRGIKGDCVGTGPLWSVLNG